MNNKREVVVPKAVVDGEYLEKRRQLLARDALAAAGFRPRYLARAMKRTVEAMEARSRYGGPDHRTRLEAADRIFRMVPGIYVRENREAAGAVTVEIVTMAPDGTKLAVKVGG